jgi:hypothetical protein
MVFWLLWAFFTTAGKRLPGFVVMKSYSATTENLNQLKYEEHIRLGAAV